MNLFPFSLPAATATYLCLYMLTLAVHVFFMGYVLAGSGHVALAALTGRPRDAPLVATLRDWLPFALGTAITAGVAPLLFLQILYKESFYTANLLLFHRFMAVVPVLIVGFYLLYLNKSEVLANKPRWQRSAVAIGAFACFSFTAYSWIENHLLALDRGAWVGMYRQGDVTYTVLESLPRMLFWLGSAVPITATWLGWQMRRRSASGAVADTGLARTLASMAILGTLASIAALIWYAFTTELPRAAIGDLIGPYLVVASASALAALIAWSHIWRSRELSRKALVVASLGVGLAMTCVIVMREALRVASVDLEHLVTIHERTAQAGGFWLFVCFAVVAAAVIAWCFSMTARALRASE